jgi:transketolase
MQIREPRPQGSSSPRAPLGSRPADRRLAAAGPSEIGLDELAVRAIRVTAADMVEAAASGHPGLPLGAAPAAWVLWSRHLRFDPWQPDWPGRDRFILSAGHGSALLYSLLHLFGMGVGPGDLARFRQYGSATPGHPERGHTPGVETTTGPLGQGLAAAVGIALAERMAATGSGETDGRGCFTFVLASDGDLMEGVASEASSLAGHLGLGRLVVLWDDNRISIDGPTTLAFTEDVPARYRAYGWAVAEVDDGEDLGAIDKALAIATSELDRPTLVRVRTTIGSGAPTKAGTAAVHGAPLGASELAGLRASLGWDLEPFRLPAQLTDYMARLCDRKRHDAASAPTPCEPPPPDPGAVAAALSKVSFDPSTPVATRQASGTALEELALMVPSLVGGSADLADSTCTRLPGPPVSNGSFTGRHIHFGVREHAMASIANGLALSGFRPVVSTFLVFSDYARPALRLAALMGLGAVHIYTHDSIWVGEDGPTHQPVEQLAALRAIPGVAVLRPADAHETLDCWRLAMARQDAPTVLVLSRQALPHLPPPEPGWLCERGARTVRAQAEPDLVIVSSGSEVSLAVEAAEILAAERVLASVVSVAWRERFLALTTEERATLVPPGAPVLVVEAASRLGWESLTGEDGDIACVDRFGMSGKGAEVAARLGFTAHAVASRALALLP